MSRVDRSRLPEVGPDPAFRFPEIAHHELANGLRVRTVEHRSVPVVTYVLHVEGGSGADPDGLQGASAMVADMLDEGIRDLSAIEVSDALSRIGADYDADVGGDATVFSLTTLRRFASQGASLLASIATEPSLRESDFTRIRQFRLDRLRQLKDIPSAVAERQFLQLLYGTHPYGHLAIGTDESLRRITLEDVATFHRRSFRSDRATLVVCGAMSHDELRRLADESFGAWPRRADAAVDAESPAGIEPAGETAARLAIIHREGAAQSELRIGQLTTHRLTPDYPALLVMNAVLGGQFVSRINLKLREEKGYTYGARTGFDWHRGISPFALQTSVHTATTVDAIVDSLAELEGIRGSRPPTDEEMLLAKASLTRGYPRAFETAQQVARSIAQLVLYGLPDTYFSEFVPRVNAVTSEDVVTAAAHHLRPDRLTTLIVGDHTAIADSLDRLRPLVPTVLSTGD